MQPEQVARLLASLPWVHLTCQGIPTPRVRKALAWDGYQLVRPSLKLLRVRNHVLHGDGRDRPNLGTDFVFGKLMTAVGA